MMKRLYYVSTVAFWLAFIAFWGASLWMPVEQKAAVRPTLAVYALSDVARHDRPGDCWMAIGGKVYDLTAYLPQHPARPEVIVPWCGKEATVAYHTKNREGSSQPHSSYASSLLQQYRIGVLREEVAR